MHRNLSSGPALIITSRIVLGGAMKVSQTTGHYPGGCSVCKVECSFFKRKFSLVIEAYQKSGAVRRSRPKILDVGSFGVCNPAQVPNSGVAIAPTNRGEFESKLRHGCLSRFRRPTSPILLSPC